MAQQGDLSHEQWPEDGRVGIVSRGEYEGFYVLVVPETWTRVSRKDRGLVTRSWYFYLVCPEAPGNPRITDDFSVDSEALVAILASMGVNWISREDDLRIEQEEFALRERWAHESSPGKPGLLRRIFSWRPD